MSKASAGKYRELPASDEPGAAAAADTPSRAEPRERVEQAEARAAAAREEAALFDEDQQRQRRGVTSSGGRRAERQLEFSQPELEPHFSARRAAPCHARSVAV